MITNNEKIIEVIQKHILWINGEDGGVKANFKNAYLPGIDWRGARLQGADLQGVNLFRARLQEINLQDANLQNADLHRTKMQGANLQGADLRGANLSGADLGGVRLQGANLCGVDLYLFNFPLWSGGTNFKCDIDFIYQLFAHICTLDFDDMDDIKKIIMPYALKFSRVRDLGLVEEIN